MSRELPVLPESILSNGAARSIAGRSLPAAGSPRKSRRRLGANSEAAGDFLISVFSSVPPWRGACGCEEKDC